MKVVFADTGYWEAVLNPKDNLNTKARAISSDLGKSRIVTTEMVLDELLTALVPLAREGIRNTRGGRYSH